MADAPHTITLLLERIRRDERGAVDELIVRFEPEVQKWIRHERGRAIKSKYDTADLSQDFFVRFLKYLPNLKAQDEETLRRLLYRMIQNMMRDRGDYLDREIRRLSRERPLPSDTLLCLDPPGETRGATPSEVIDHGIEQGFMRVALTLVEPEERELILRRWFDNEDFPALAERMKLAPDAVRMRCNRAMARLVKVVGRLRRGEMKKLLDELPPVAGSADAES